MDQRQQSGRNKKSKGGRSSDISLVLRRFFREIQQSRILSEAKKRRFFSKDISRREKRAAARRKTYVKKLKRGY